VTISLPQSYEIALWLSTKEVRSREWGVVHCGQRRLFRCGSPNFLLQKNFSERFFKNHGVSARTRGVGWGRLRQFGQMGKRVVNFLRFCADVFYGQPIALQNIASKPASVVIQKVWGVDFSFEPKFTISKIFWGLDYSSFPYKLDTWYLIIYTCQSISTRMLITKM